MRYTAVAFLMLMMAGCARHPGAGQGFTAGAAKSKGCATTDLAAVYRDPPSWLGKRFCGEVVLVPTDRIMPAFPAGAPSRWSQDSYDGKLAFLDPKTDMRIRRLTNFSRDPHRVFVVAKITGTPECFDPVSGHDCVPWKAFILNVRSFRQVGPA